MSTRHLFLHIGTHKTGSSSIQKALTMSSARLAKHGVYYPMEGAYYWQGESSQSLLAHSLLGKHPLYLSHIKFDMDECLSDIKRDIQNSTLPNIVISSEHFSLAQSAEKIQSIYDFFSQIVDKITIIVYLRRQDNLLESTWGQLIKQGQTTQSFQDRIDSHGNYWDYYIYFNSLGKFFGEEAIIVRPFEKNQLYENDVVRDFMRVIGFRLNRQLSINTNQAPPVEQLEVLRHFGKSQGSYQQRVAFCNFVASLPIKWDQTKYSLFTPEKRNAFMSKYRESNIKVAKQYLNRVDHGLFLESETDSRPVYPGLSLERFSEISTQIITIMSQQNQKLFSQLKLVSKMTK